MKRITKWYYENKRLLGLIIGCFLVFNILLLLTHLFAENPNEFGDSAGAANGLFSAFAFAGVIYAIFLQKSELELQREELKNTSEELKAQKIEFEQQNDILRHQRFENSLFQMLSFQQEIVNGLSLSHRATFCEVNMIGRKIFESIYEEDCKLTPTKVECCIKNKIKKTGIEGYIDWRTFCLDHYFRHLYRIIKFIDETPLLLNDLQERYQYTCLVRSQLSRYELVHLFYNCLSSNGYRKFKPLIEKYALLKNVQRELLVDDKDRHRYSHGAFRFKRR